MMSKFEGVADTLYIPLTARVYVSKRFPDFFYDPMALQLEKEIPGDSIQEGSSEYSMMASVARYHEFDRVVRTFIQGKDACSIVNLGCGLETMAWRLETPGVTYYEMDLPEVMELRQRVLGKKDNEVFVSGSLLENDWLQQIPADKPTLFVVSGVFQYFHEEDVLRIIRWMQEAFPQGELLFDVMTKRALSVANRYVRKTGNTSAEMHFFINKTGDFTNKSGTVLLEDIPFFRDVRKKLGRQLTLSTNISMLAVDLGMGRILHLRLTKEN